MMSTTFSVCTAVCLLSALEAGRNSVASEPLVTERLIVESTSKGGFQPVPPALPEGEFLPEAPALPDGDDGIERIPVVNKVTTLPADPAPSKNTLPHGKQQPSLFEMLAAEARAVIRAKSSRVDWTIKVPFNEMKLFQAQCLVIVADPDGVTISGERIRGADSLKTALRDRFMAPDSPRAVFLDIHDLKYNAAESIAYDFCRERGINLYRKIPSNMVMRERCYTVHQVLVRAPERNHRRSAVKDSKSQ